MSAYNRQVKPKRRINRLRKHHLPTNPSTPFPFSTNPNPHKYKYVSTLLKHCRTRRCALLLAGHSTISLRALKSPVHTTATTSSLKSIAKKMFTPRTIAKKFVAREQGEGAGARVHRSIGTTRLRNLDPFLMLDEFNVGLPGGFPDHPHRGFETVTYVLPTSKGHMCHEDFLGNKGELRPGDLQWMTPGRGIMHAEMPKSEVPAHGLQLWINLPSKSRMVEPKYQEISRDTVPHAFNEDKSIEAIVFAGEVFGKRGPIETAAPVTYVHFMLQAGAKLEYPIPESHHVFVYAVSGTGKCVEHSIQPHEAIVLEMKGDGVQLQADENDQLEVIVMTGQPLEEPVVQYGPFVMSTGEEIQQTWEDFQLGKNGFENAHSWASEIGNRRR